MRNPRANGRTRVRATQKARPNRPGGLVAAARNVAGKGSAQAAASRFALARVMRRFSFWNSGVSLDEPLVST